MDSLKEIWKAVEDYTGDGAKSFSRPSARIQIYKGAMAIPLVVFHPKNPPVLDESRMEVLSNLLTEMGLELDLVESGENYKINRGDTKTYVGRITRESLKISIARILELGEEVFSKIVEFYLQPQKEVA